MSHSTVAGTPTVRTMPHYLAGLVNEIEQCGGHIHITIQGNVVGTRASHTATHTLPGQAVDYLRLVAWGVLGMVEGADGTTLGLMNAPPHTNEKKWDSKI